MLIIVVTSIVGTALVKGAEYIFGAVNVFMFATSVVAIVGLIIPVMQIKNK